MVNVSVTYYAFFDENRFPHFCECGNPSDPFLQKSHLMPSKDRQTFLKNQFFGIF